MDEILDKIENAFAESCRVVYLNKRYGINVWMDRERLSELRDIYLNQKALCELNLIDPTLFKKTKDLIKTL